MQTKFAKHLRKLWNLAGEIGSLGEEDNRYGAVYEKLSDALDVAERVGLIKNIDETEEEAKS